MRIARIVFLMMSSAFLAMADSSIDPSHPYAYGANIGWINTLGDTQHGAVIGQYSCTGYLYSANIGWIALGNGPTNGLRYSNTSETDWGVNHDGVGNLTGCAYGANIGWINFEQTYGQPRVDLRTGTLYGYVYGANVGWISLSNVQAYVRTQQLGTGPDTDTDGLPDAWEYEHTNTLTVLQALPADRDGDGVPDRSEYVADSDPLNPGDYLEITRLSRAGGTNFVTWNSRPTRIYQLEGAGAVSSNPWTNVFDESLGPLLPSPMQVGVTGAVSGLQFYRAQALVPLSE